jgi:hypothetical protein
MKKILIGGCSFSQSTGFPIDNDIPKWTSWTNFLEKDFSESYEIINRAQSSFGQSRIVESLLEELLKFEFDIDYVFIQWSAIGRAYSTNERDFFNRMIIQSEVPFSPHQHEYIVNDDKEGWITNLTNEISDSFYTASLNQIFLLKSLLDSKRIPYIMFWGWEQLNNNTITKNKNLIDKIYDERFWRWKNNGGMSDYITDNIGFEKGIIPNDFHPSTEGHKFFYNTIIKNILKTI